MKLTAWSCETNPQTGINVPCHGSILHKTRLKLVQRV